MTSILTNVAALGASRQLGATATGLQRTIQRLTTGRRINRASDDAAGLAISNKLGADVRVAGQARRNANDGVSYLQVADGTLDEVTDLLTRAAELAQQAQTGTISNANRTALDSEFQGILASISDLGLNSKFNGQAIFGSSLTIAVGSYSTIGITVASIAAPAGLTHVTGAAGSVTTPASPSFGPVGPGSYAPAGATNVNITTGNYLVPGLIVNFNNPSPGYVDWTQGWGGPTAINFNYDYDLPGSATVLGMTLGSTNLTSASGAQAAATLLGAALDSVSSLRASIGASEQQLGSISNALGIQVENFTSAYSQIRDANLADEVVNLSKFQILNQSGTAALVQANGAQQGILALLRVG